MARLLDRRVHLPGPGRGELRPNLGAQLIAATGETEIDSLLDAFEGADPR